MVKRLAAFLCAVMLMLSVSAVVFAHEAPDMERDDCSISIIMHMGETKIPGGTLRLYRVGEIQENDGSYSWVPTGDFADCGLSFANVQSSDLAEGLEKIAAKLKPLKEEPVGEDCEVVFEGLNTGLYLVVQSEAAAGYQKAQPFLVSVPYYKEENGEYDYSVNAYPKVDVEKVTETTVPSTTKPDDERLPQTGQLNWPVPLMMVLGLALMIAGWALRFGRKTEKYEK